MNSLQDQGRSLYKRGEYREAIKCFDRAIGRGSSVQLLDNRAACYEKLNELSSALQDAKKAIHLRREDPTGYLRAAQVLTKMSKHPVALEIYSHGLKSVKHVGQGYEFLKKAHKQCLDIVSPPRSVDPLTVLPRELAQLILEHLSFRQRMNACLVSRGWNHYIRSLPDLWSHLDLSGARKKVRSSFVSTAINKGRSKLRKATLHNLYDADKALNAIARACPLEELVLLECGIFGSASFLNAMERAAKLKSLTIKPTFNVGCLEAALEAISGHIESITLTSVNALAPPPCERLTHFSASMTDFFDTVQLLERVPKLYPNIQSLVLKYSERAHHTNFETYDLASCLHLRHLDLAVPLSPNDVLTLPPTLETLRLDPMVYGDSDDVVYDVLLRSPKSLRLPALQELELTLGDSGCCLWLFAMLQGFENDIYLEPDETRSWSRLRRLSLCNGCIAGVDMSQTLAIDRLQDLEELSMPNVYDCDDSQLNEIVSALPKLRVLDLTGSVITGVGVKTARRKTRIKELNLTNCRKVEVDAVEWARSEGVKVKYKVTC